MCERGRRLCDDAGRLLRGVGGVRRDWSGLVGVAGQENEAAAGREPRGMEVPLMTISTAGHRKFLTSSHVLLRR